MTLLTTKVQNQIRHFQKIKKKTHLRNGVKEKQYNGYRVNRHDDSHRPGGSFLLWFHISRSHRRPHSRNWTRLKNIKTFIVNLNFEWKFLSANDIERLFVRFVMSCRSFLKIGSSKLLLLELEKPFSSVSSLYDLCHFSHLLCLQQSSEVDIFVVQLLE